MNNTPFAFRSILPWAFVLMLALPATAEKRAVQIDPAPQKFVRDENPALAEGKPMIQIALLLDTSSSMQGLINQAKTHLWEIVNEMATAKREGKDPLLQIGLYEYGRNTLPAANFHVRKVVPMTTDFDKVYEKLVALNATKSPGSNEQCARVIQASVKELGWSGKNDDLKSIFIAGNESFAQGTLSYKDACKAAIESGITINTIFCGSHAQGISQSWQDGALLADGMYVNIDHNRTVAAVQAPQDAEIAKLNRELNQTYVARGNVGQKAKRRQEALDDKAQEQSAETAVSRAVAKAGKYYDAADWDVVDAVESEKLDLASAKNEELPEKMRGMSVEERKAYVEELAAKRAHLRDQITKLNEERKVHVASKQKQGGANGLNNAIIDGLKKEASKKNFDLK